jgi:predicted nucleic acid-binding protein
MTRLIGKEPCITFVTLGELIQWAEQTPAVGPAQPRRLGSLARRRDRLLPYTHDVARRWGQISAYAIRRGRPRPAKDSWIAACALSYGLPLATLNAKDFEDFAEHEGLTLITR